MVRGSLSLTVHSAICLFYFASFNSGLSPIFRLDSHTDIIVQEGKGCRRESVHGVPRTQNRRDRICVTQSCVES